MEEVVIRLNQKNHGAFYLMLDGEQVGEMMIGIDNGVLTAFHTEIHHTVEGRGLAKHLLDGMVAYAREHKLKVRPLCVYVQAQFKKHAEEYADLMLQS